MASSRNYTMEFDNIETIKRAVEIGLGCAIVPRLTVENEMARGSLKMIEFQEGPFTRPLAIIYKRGRELSPAARKFIEVLTTSNLTPHAQGHSEKATRDRDRVERERGDHRETGRARGKNRLTRSDYRNSKAAGLAGRFFESLVATASLRDSASSVIDAQTHSHQLQTKLPANRGGRFAQRAQRHSFVIGIQQTVERCAAGAHSARHLGFGKVFLLHRGFNLAREDALDRGRSHFRVDALLAQPAIEG